jgi:hypothetical protein
MGYYLLCGFSSLEDKEQFCTQSKREDLWLNVKIRKSKDQAGFHS